MHWWLRICLCCELIRLSAVEAARERLAARAARCARCGRAVLWRRRGLAAGSLWSPARRARCAVRSDNPARACSAALGGRTLVGNRPWRAHIDQRAYRRPDVTRRDSFAARLDSLLDVENAAAQLIANALRRTVVLRPGCLLADALPAPYITVTDMCGTRYLLTAHHKLFLRMGLVPHDAPRGNVSTLSPHAHAEMLAVWDAVQRLKSLAHVAAPAGGDWRVFAIQSARARRSFWHQVRASRRRRALSRLTSRAAALAPVLRVVLPARRSLVVRDIGRQLMAGRGHEMPGLTDAPALRAGDGGDA
jgi:hypothetical protein